MWAAPGWIASGVGCPEGAASEAGEFRVRRVCIRGRRRGEGFGLRAGPGNTDGPRRTVGPSCHAPPPTSPCASSGRTGHCGGNHPKSARPMKARGFPARPVSRARAVAGQGKRRRSAARRSGCARSDGGARKRALAPCGAATSPKDRARGRRGAGAPLRNDTHSRRVRQRHTRIGPVQRICSEMIHTAVACASATPASARCSGSAPK
jgi:hypothetical protein